MTRLKITSTRMVDCGEQEPITEESTGIQGQKFNIGDIVTIRKESEPARIIKPIFEDGIWWYEVEAVYLNAVFHRHVKQVDLHLA